jgi:hypothetical protein
MALKVVDRFTTRDGLWEVDPRPYGLTKEDLEEYGSWDIPGMGAAAHLFVKAKPGDTVRFNTVDGNNPNAFLVGESGWINFPIFASSAFWGVDGGPWIAWVNNVEVARGLGLPDGLHVSTFLIVEDVDSGSQPEPPTTGEWVEYVMRTKVDDIYVKEEIVWLKRTT